MGEGGFGAVYRGMQQDGTEIAVKVRQNCGDDSEKNEQTWGFNMN